MYFQIWSAFSLISVDFERSNGKWESAIIELCSNDTVYRLRFVRLCGSVLNNRRELFFSARERWMPPAASVMPDHSLVVEIWCLTLIALREPSVSPITSQNSDVPQWKVLSRKEEMSHASYSTRGRLLAIREVLFWSSHISIISIWNINRSMLKLSIRYKQHIEIGIGSEVIPWNHWRDEINRLHLVYSVHYSTLSSLFIDDTCLSYDFHEAKCPF